MDTCLHTTIANAGHAGLALFGPRAELLGEAVASD